MEHIRCPDTARDDPLFDSGDGDNQNLPTNVHGDKPREDLVFSILPTTRPASESVEDVSDTVHVLSFSSAGRLGAQRPGLLQLLFEQRITLRGNEGRVARITWRHL